MKFEEGSVYTHIILTFEDGDVASNRPSAQEKALQTSLKKEEKWEKKPRKMLNKNMTKHTSKETTITLKRYDNRNASNII